MLESIVKYVLFAMRKPKKRRKKRGGSKKRRQRRKKRASLGNCGVGRWALLLGGFLPPEPPEFERKKNVGFYEPVQWIRGGPLGDARSRARQSISKAFLRVHHAAEGCLRSAAD